PILRVADAGRALAWYGRLGFTKEWEHRFEPGMPAFVSIARGRARLFLSEHLGDARPDTLVYLVVGDIDAVVAEFGRPAGEPPWGGETDVRAPAGNGLGISPPAGWAARLPCPRRHLAGGLGRAGSGWDNRRSFYGPALIITAAGESALAGQVGLG